jgi:hypothetical protein
MENMKLYEKILAKYRDSQYLPWKHGTLNKRKKPERKFSLIWLSGQNYKSASAVLKKKVD